MRTPIIVTLMMVMLAVVIGCGESSDNGTDNNAFPDGADLLGLMQNHNLHYIVYDSVVTVSPESLIVTRDTSFLDVSVVRGQQNQVELDVDGLAHDLLTVDQSGVLHSGQIRPLAQPADTLYYYPTPVIMPRVLPRRFGRKTENALESHLWLLCRTGICRFRHRPPAFPVLHGLSFPHRPVPGSIVVRHRDDH
jgi:hypothetical protein